MKKFKAVYAKSYTDQQGVEKTSWKQLGFANEVFNQEKGTTTIHLTLDSIPTGDWNGEVKLFEQEEKQNNQGQQQGQQQNYGGQNQGYQQ